MHVHVHVHVHAHVYLYVCTAAAARDLQMVKARRARITWGPRAGERDGSHVAQGW